MRYFTSKTRVSLKYPVSYCRLRKNFEDSSPKPYHSHLLSILAPLALSSYICLSLFLYSKSLRSKIQSGFCYKSCNLFSKDTVSARVFWHSLLKRTLRKLHIQLEIPSCLGYGSKSFNLKSYDALAKLNVLLPIDTTIK